MNRLIILMSFTVTILLAGCTELANTSGEGGAIDLAFNFNPDSLYQYTIKNNIELTQEMDEEKSITIQQNMTLTSGCKVISKNSGNSTVSVTYERITMSSGNHLFSLDYDSENDNGTDVMYEDLRNLIDRNFKMTVSEKGDIISSEPVMKNAVHRTGAYHFSDSSIRNVMLHSLQIYPGMPVEVGDVWEKTFSTSVGFANVRIRNQYQLVSVSGGVAHIELQGRIASDKTNQTDGANVQLNGTQSGALEVEVGSGLVQGGKITQILSGDMNITGAYTPVSIESDIYIMGTTKKQMVPGN